MIRCQPCSVIHGSKLSGLLFTLYYNDVPGLHHLKEDSKWLESKLNLKKESYKENDHSVINFVDDSNSILSFRDPGQINHYSKR